MSNLSLVQIQALAQSLFVAGNNVRSIAPTCDDLSVADAYLVQDAFTLLQQNRGNSLIGYKMGLTNQAKMDLANVCEPLKGQLFAKMLLKDGDSLSLSELIQPRVEPEIAFVLRDELYGDDLTVVDVINATEYITGALEIVDSRYHDFKFSFSAGIADNICAARVVLGNEKFNPRDFDLTSIQVKLFVNQIQQAFGVSSVVLENPINSVIALAKLLNQGGQKLAAGSVVITGAITDAVSIKVGDEVSAEFSQLGNIAFSVRP